MGNTRRSLIIFSILVFIVTISYSIINYMNCTHTTDSECTNHILKTNQIAGENVNGVLLWELEYADEVNNIIKDMTTDAYMYPITVDQLKTLQYLYCRGHKVYLRGSTTNTITRRGDLGTDGTKNLYTIETITGETGPLGKTEKVEVDTYTYANDDLTFNEWTQYGTTYDKTTKQIYDKMQIFVIPGINGDHAKMNDDHDCNGDEKKYQYQIEPTLMDSMTRFKLKIEENGSGKSGEPLYTDETDPFFMAYDAAKAYIFTVVKGGHYGIGQLASWRLRDNLGLWQTNAEYEIHDGITKGIVTKEDAIEIMTLKENLYQIQEITSTKVEVSEDDTHEDGDNDEDEFQEDTMDYEESLEEGQAGILYQEAIAMAKHVYSTETFKDSHNDSLIADCTDKVNLNVNYVKEGDYYLVGPFNLEYVRSVIKSKESPIKTVADSDAFSLGGLTGATLTYTRIDGTQGTLTVDASKTDFEFVVTDKYVDREFDTAYKFPYPEEKFYLKIPYQGENEQEAIKTLDKIEYTLDNTYAKGQVYNLIGRYHTITWDDNKEDYKFKCEESATVCPTHHTSNAHCSSCGPCTDHTSGGPDCDKNQKYNVANGSSCSCGYWAGLIYVPCSCSNCGNHTACTTKTLCETHHEVAGSNHARNRAYWIEVTNISAEKPAQPLMWMKNASVHRRTYTAISELNIDMTMDFGGFVWVDAYTQKGTNEDGSTYYYNDDIYDPSIQIDNNGVDALKQYVEVYLLKKVAEGGTAKGTQYISDYKSNIRDTGLYHAVDSSGKIIKAITDQNGEYFFDEIPVLDSNYEGYVVAFVYDGQTYTAVDPLYKQIAKTQPVSEEASEEYINATFKYNKFYNSSMGKENPDERQDFNNKFEEFLGKNDIDLTAHSTVGQVYGNEYDGEKYSKEYNEVDYAAQANSSDRVYSKLVTTQEGEYEGIKGATLEGKTVDTKGMTDPFYKLESRTSEAGLVYPLEDVYNIRMGDTQVDSLGTDANYNSQDADIDFEGKNVTTPSSGDLKFDNIETTYGTNQNSTSTPGNGKSKGYTARINLGLVTRPQADLSVTKDLYTARTIVKGQDMTYAYGEALRTEEEYSYAGLTSTNDTTTWTDSRDVQTAIGKKQIFYNLYLYESDYDYNSAVEYITQSDDIKKVRMGRYTTTTGYGNATDPDDTTLLYNYKRANKNCSVCDERSTGLCKYHQAEVYDTELRSYLTYKITIRNEGSVAVLAEVNELIDYHDDSLQLITENVYAALVDGEENQMIDSEGNPNIQLIATPSTYYYYKAGQNESAHKGTVMWLEEETEETKGKAPIISGSEYDKNNPTSVNYTKLKSSKNGFRDASGNEIKLAKNERIEIYVTYRIKEEARDVYVNDGTKDIKVAGSNGYEESGKIILGHKYNIAEVGNYSTYAKSNPNVIYGRVDKDSAPDNINLSNGEKTHYDDDGDAAPPINVSILGSTEDSLEVSDEMGELKDELQAKYAATRTITGTVWEDARTSRITDYESYVGNGILDENETRIEGVTVQLVEIIQTEDGTSKEVLLPDRKASNAMVDSAGNVAIGDKDNEKSCEYKYETKTDKNGVYTFTNIPAGTYVVRFIYGKDILTTQYYYPENETEEEKDARKEIRKDKKIEPTTTYSEDTENIKISINHDDKTVTYDLDEDIVQTFKEMPQTYNGQDYKSTTYQPNVDTNINSDGYIDNEWDTINTTNAGIRVSDARDNEVRRLENIAYSRTVNNKVATELDALSTNSSPSALSKYGFSIGIINGIPQILVDTSAKENGVPNNSQTQLNTIENVNGVESVVISNNGELINNPDIASVASYTWMYADTAKMNIGLENEMLSEEIKSNFVINSEYNDEYLKVTSSSINYGDINPEEYAKDMLSTITHLERIVSPASEPKAHGTDNSIRKSAYIYNVLPGQIQITLNDKAINNFDLDEKELEDKFGYSTSGASASKEIISYPLVNRIYNVDFGIVERPKTSVELEKWVSSLKLELSDGRTLFDIPFEEFYDDGVLKTKILENECKSDVYDPSTEDGREAILSNLQTVNNTEKVQGFIHVDMDDELLQGATITVGYKMKVTNTSEVDTVGLLSYLDDGDTVMQIASYIKEIAVNDPDTLLAIGESIGVGKLQAYFDKVIKEADDKITEISTSSVSAVEKQYEIAKQENVKVRMKNAKDKITVLGDRIAPVSEYKINNPIQKVTMSTGTGAEIMGGGTTGETSKNEKVTTPYGLFLGTTYYTGKKASGNATVYAVESKVEQIVDYVDTQLGLDESTVGVQNSSWTKLDLTQLFGLYTQSNVLNGANPLKITNEGTLINIFESAVINISKDVLDLVNAKLSEKIDFTTTEDLAETYRTIYETLLTYVGVDVTLEELVNSLGDKGVIALIEIYNQINNTADDATKKLLQSIIAGLTITDKDGNSYITLELTDENNELRNNVVISVNDPEINVDIGNYLVPKTVNELNLGKVGDEIKFAGTNNGLGDAENTLYSADIELYAQKTVSATALNDEISNMVFNNAAEIVQISNKVGRKDKMAVAGNLLIAEGEWESTTGYDPDEGKEVKRTTILNPSASSQIFAEYDSAATARIIFTPPTGRGISAIIHNEIFQGGLIGLGVLAVGIFAIKVIFFKKKKIYK